MHLTINLSKKFNCDLATLHLPDVINNLGILSILDRLNNANICFIFHKNNMLSLFKQFLTDNCNLVLSNFIMLEAANFEITFSHIFNNEKSVY